MKQHLVDLLPDSIRTRSESGMVIGRYVSISVVVVMVLAALSTHAHFRLDRIEAAYKAAEAKSRLVLEVEGEAKQLRAALSDLEHSIQQYERVAPSLRLTDLQSLVISQLPPSVTLESMTFVVQQRNPVFDPRIKDSAKAKPQREIRAELAGFARSSLDVTELVKRLHELNPFRGVSINSSRSRLVRNVHASEFSVSFFVDLDHTYDVTYVGRRSAAPSHIVTGEEARDVE